MKRSIFDSESEKRLHKKLISRWSRYVEVYPQIPVRNVIGYHEIKTLDMPEAAKNYLLNTAFDFVVCELNTSIPILVIEFDGIGLGFSQDEKYIPKVIPINDPHIKLKMERKLEACTFFMVPLVVLSFYECEVINQSNEMLMVLDAVIGKGRGTGIDILINSSNMYHSINQYPLYPSFKQPPVLREASPSLGPFNGYFEQSLTHFFHKT
jgi:hypothetical protein